MRQPSTLQSAKNPPTEYHYCVFEYNNLTSGRETLAVVLSQNPDTIYDRCARAAHNATLEMTRSTRIPEVWYFTLRLHGQGEADILEELGGRRTSNEKRRNWLKIGRDRVHKDRKGSEVTLQGVVGFNLFDEE